MLHLNLNPRALGQETVWASRKFSHFKRPQRDRMKNNKNVRKKKKKVVEINCESLPRLNMDVRREKANALAMINSGVG